MTAPPARADLTISAPGSSSSAAIRAEASRTLLAGKLQVLFKLLLLLLELPATLAQELVHSTAVRQEILHESDGFASTLCGVGREVAAAPVFGDPVSQDFVEELACWDTTPGGAGAELAPE